jgi:hypothetical protein
MVVAASKQGSKPLAHAFKRVACTSRTCFYHSITPLLTSQLHAFELHTGTLLTPLHHLFLATPPAMQLTPLP